MTAQLTVAQIRELTDYARDNAIRPAVVHSAAQARTMRHMEIELFGRILTDWRVGDEFYVLRTVDADYLARPTS